jgi:hypothetical protein
MASIQGIELFCAPDLEFNVAVIGPVSSLTIGGLLGLAWYLLGGFHLSPLIVAPLEYGGFISPIHARKLYGGRLS